MKDQLTFSDTLQASLRGWNTRRADECVLSLALPHESIDPLDKLIVIADREQFSFLWDQNPGLSIAAAGKCQSFELVGPRRFELAQRFSNETLERLVDLSPEAPIQAKPRILFAFTFFEQTADVKKVDGHIPALQAVLPRWQLSRHSFGKTWLRFNSVVTQESDVREFIEKFWLMREKLAESSFLQITLKKQIVSSFNKLEGWKGSYKRSLMKGIDLVESSELEKLVLAVKQMVELKEPLDTISLLSSLRQNQKGSCRFLWQRSKQDAFFGASPERLLSLKKGEFQIDALAGTARKGDDGLALMKSAKNLREHELVVSSINNQLIEKGLHPSRLRSPRLAKHGNLIHLHTPIKASAKGFSALQLVKTLHPTPAVAGFPRTKSIQWLRTLEPFDRGYYAAPLGWVDTSGNAEFRVAIRCGYTRSNCLHLIAGAGLVRGSTVEGELQEVESKFAVLADQLNLNLNSHEKSFSRHSMI